MATNATVTVLDSWDEGDKAGHFKRKWFLVQFVATGNPTIVLADLSTPAMARFHELFQANRTETTATAATFVRATNNASIAEATITTGTWTILVSTS